MKFILILILTMFTLNSFSQGVYIDKLDSITISTARELVNKSTNEKVLIYKTGCIGCYYTDSCRCSGVLSLSYIIWQSDSTLKIKKLDCCENEREYTVPINVDLWSALDSNKIFESQFKSRYYVDHYAVYELILIDGQEEKSLRIYDYYFYEKDKNKLHNEEQAGYKYLTKLKEFIKEL